MLVQHCFLEESLFVKVTVSCCKDKEIFIVILFNEFDFKGALNPNFLNFTKNKEKIFL